MPTPTDGKTRAHVSETPPAASFAQIGPWLQRAFGTGFGDPTAFHKFQHPGTDVQIPPATPQGSGVRQTDAERARAALVDAMGQK